MKRTLLVLVVLVGTSSGVSIASSITPQSLTQENATEYPPGLSAEGVTDPLALADAHRDALSNASYAMTTTTTFQRPNGSILSEAITRRRVARGGSSFSVVNARSQANDTRPLGIGHVELAVWANETESVSARRSDAAGPTYRQHSRDDAPLEPDEQWGLVYSAMDATNTTVVNRFERNDTSLFRVVSTAQPGQGSVFASRSNYSLVAVVDSQGVVRTLQLTYWSSFDGEPAIVSRTIQVSNLGNTTVERPPWYQQAMTDESENETA